MFTLCVLLAAEATQRAAAGRTLRPLVLAGVWVGIGFQAKISRPGRYCPRWPWSTWSRLPCPRASD